MKRHDLLMLMLTQEQACQKWPFLTICINPSVLLRLALRPLCKQPLLLLFRHGLKPAFRVFRINCYRVHGQLIEGSHQQLQEL